MLKNKIAVVSGGNSGIGFAIVKLFLANGAKVAVFDRSIHRLESEIESSNLFVKKGDLRKLSDISSFYDEVHEKFGKIDILAASAGISKMADIESVTEEMFDSVVDVNFKGTFFTVQKSVKYLKDKASVILISSTAAHRAVAGKSIYAATKAAISQLAKNFAADLASKKIRVNAISPGTIQTPMLGENLSREFMRKIGDRIPFKSIGSPQDIADYALFLASDRSAYITGTDLTVDGGLSSFTV